MAEGDQNVTGQISRSAGSEATSVAGAVTSMRVDEMISNLAIGIAHGQMELDQTCMEIAQFMADAQVAFGKKPGSDEPDLVSLIELGFTPNFYQFVDTIIEVRVSVSTQYEETRTMETSEMDTHTEQAEVQSSYEAQQSRRDTGVRSSGASVGWRWGWWGGRASSHSYVNSGVSSASSSRRAGSSSFKSKSLRMTTVDAKFSSTYNYSVEASSLVKTKIVPVPPPAVFEEVVRAKMQERRDAEERFRLTVQLEAMLPRLVNSANAITGDEYNFPKSDSDLTQGLALALDEKLAKLREDYGRLTIDQWAIVRSVQDRQTADTALERAAAQMAAILEGYPDEDPDTLPVDGAEALKSLQAVESRLKQFAKKIEEIQQRLFPPEPEPLS